MTSLIHLHEHSATVSASSASDVVNGPKVADIDRTSHDQGHERDELREYSCV